MEYWYVLVICQHQSPSDYWNTTCVLFGVPLQARILLNYETSREASREASRWPREHPADTAHVVRLESLDAVRGLLGVDASILGAPAVSAAACDKRPSLYLDQRNGFDDSHYIHTLFVNPVAIRSLAEHY